MFSIGFSEIVSSLAVILTLVLNLTSRTGKSAKADAEMQGNIKVVRQIVEDIRSDIARVESQQSKMQAETTERFAEFGERNSESHTKLHVKVDQNTHRIVEHEYRLRGVEGKIQKEV